MNYTYDLDSHLTQLTDPTGTYQFTFNNMGRLTAATTSYTFLTARTFTTGYSYDAASNRTGLTDPENGSTTYLYDTLNRLQTLTPPSAFSGTGSFGFSYDALSRRTQMTRPNNVATNYGYDNLSRLQSVLHQLAGSTIDGATYTVDTGFGLDEAKHPSPRSQGMHIHLQIPLGPQDMGVGTATFHRGVSKREMSIAGLNSMSVISSLLSISAILSGQDAASIHQSSNLCEVQSLPLDIQNLLKHEYGSWKIQEAANLSQHAREAWEPEKPLACPGIAVGYFESAKALAYAVLLVPTGHADEGYRFLVFSQKPGQPGYEVRLLHKLDEKGAANYYIRSTPISKFFDGPSRKKFQAHTKDGILLTDSGENEYGVEVYFWSGGGYRHEPIDY